MTLNTFTNNRLNEVASTCQKVIPWFEGIDDKGVSGFPIKVKVFNEADGSYQK